MALTTSLAREWLEVGFNGLSARDAAWKRREEYFRGIQDDPFAPEGVNDEYKSLQRQAKVNILDLAMGAPIQRLKPEGFRTGRDGKADLTAWNEIWQPNKLDSRSRIVFQDMMNHGLGMMSVSANPLNPRSPRIRPENGRYVWIEPDPEDPFEGLFAVKRVTATGGGQRAYLYTASEWVQFDLQGKEWGITDGGAHSLGELPFEPFTFNVDSNGVPHAPIEGMMPQQDAVNTIRFQTLLAMQFSAYRQRAITGFDPVARDEKGNPLIKKDSEGNPILDANGLPQPVITSPGRVGVDRALVFPGEQTKIFDLGESNLQNYISVYDTFLTTFFATGHVPPQYALTKMANTSGDAMAGAESTFQSLISDLKTAAGESIESVMRKANRARGDAFEDVASETIWGDSEIKSFAQIVDAVVKLVGSGMAPRDAWAMLPGATPPLIDRWVTNAQNDLAQQDQAMSDLAGKLAGGNVA